MKKRQNNSARASALQVTLSLALLSVSAILFASSFRAAAPAAPGGPQPNTVAMSDAASQNAPTTVQQSGFYPPLAPPATSEQPGFYPPLPPTAAEGNLITVSLPIATFDTSVPA